VDAGGEGGVFAGGEGVGGVGEEGNDRGAATAGGVLQGTLAVVIGCAQRQRMLADQELDNGGVAGVEAARRRALNP